MTIDPGQLYSAAALILVWVAFLGFTRWADRRQRHIEPDHPSLVLHSDDLFDLYDQDQDELIETLNRQTFHRRTLTPEEWAESAKRVRVHVKRAGKGRA